MKYDLETIKYINLFENLTGSHVKECLLNNERLVFIVKAEEIKRAIGKNGFNIKKFEHITNKRIKVVAYSTDPIFFVKSFIAPIIAKKIEVENDIINIYVVSISEKGLLIGRERKNIEILKSVVKRYYKEIKDVKIA